MNTGHLDRSTVDFLVFDWLRSGELIARAEFAEHTHETFTAALDLAAQLADQEFAAHYRKSDREEPRLVNGRVQLIPEISQALRAFSEAGFSASAFPSSVGGHQLPALVSTSAFAFFTAANIATAAYPMLTMANARLLLAHGTRVQIDRWARPQIEGRFFGTMCLSEPQAGSSLSDITTRATSDGADEAGERYRLRGSKMWISGGDHEMGENIVHLVLAKVPGPDGRLVPGVSGVSLFLVPKVLPDGTRNDIAVAGLNHKMGYRGTVNCLLSFGEGEGAVGWRVGDLGQGLPIMFQMMNEARIMVGLGGAALACRGYRRSVDYARERLQGRLPTRDARDPGLPPVPIIAHPDVRRMLLAQKAYAEGALSLVLLCARLVDDSKTALTTEEQSEADLLLGLLTPVAKTWPAEWGLIANDLAIQVHGGYGYTREFEVEQLWRDNRLNPIHEGTSGIQALDLVGRKIVRDKGTALAVLRKRIGITVSSMAAGTELARFASELQRAWDEVEYVARVLMTVRDPGRTLDNASAFLGAFGHAVIAWIWLDQILALEAAPVPRSHDFVAGKRHACRYFFEWELPKIYHPLGRVAAQSASPADAPPDSF